MIFDIYLIYSKRIYRCGNGGEKRKEVIEVYFELGLYVVKVVIFICILLCFVRFRYIIKLKLINF